MGIHEVKTAPRSPWPNPYVERLIGTLRRECLDHVVVLSETNLHRLLRDYLTYYHRVRTHLLRTKAQCTRRTAPAGSPSTWMD